MSSLSVETVHMLLFWRMLCCGWIWRETSCSLHSQRLCSSAARACFGGDAAEQPAERQMSQQRREDRFFSDVAINKLCCWNFKRCLTDHPCKWRYPQPRTCSWTREDEAAQWALRKITFTSTRKNWKTSQTTSRTEFHSHYILHGPSGSIGMALFTHPTDMHSCFYFWLSCLVHAS